MDEKLEFTPNERQESLEILERLRTSIGDTLKIDDEAKLRDHIHSAIKNNLIQRDVFGLNPILHALRTAQIAVDEIGLKRDGVLAILLYTSVVNGYATADEIKDKFGDNVAHIIRGLVRIHELYKKNPVIESENFRNLLISFAEDMRVILIMIADRVNLMRQIKDTEATEAQHEVSEEASYLYAPLAHKLGLYKLKSELEDLSLKYLEHDAYYMIKDKLNATKRSRDAYIESFINPIQKKLENAGLKFHMKGRTKSIHSIWQKMKKQKCGFEGIYDLFAIRIIIDSPLEKEKMQCWQAYSIVTDMYQPNPKRLRGLAIRA
jgi:guanosine-3',5'-bis(diphosphate) 3'-pyrophosphohydrolase